MDWSKGYSARYKVEAVKVTDRFAEDIEVYEFIAGSITKDADSELKESASLTLGEPIGERWVRVYLEADQQGSSALEAIFTGLTSSPKRVLNGSHSEYTVDCYSVLKPAKDILVDRGYYVAAGSSAEKVKDLLSVTPFEVEVVGESPLTKNIIIAESGESRLSMAYRILDALGWDLTIDGNGNITIHAPHTDPTETYDVTYDVVENEITDTSDFFEIPNIFRAVDDELVAVARDDDPDSELSTINRGREIWMEETDVSLNDGENLAEYAIRRLKEEQNPVRTLDYYKRFLPDIYPGDIVSMHYPGISLYGNFKIVSQNITLGYSPRVKEVVNEYR